MIPIKTNNRSVASLIPAHNEELVIAKTLQSILAQSQPEDVYVVDDGSHDGTSKVALKYTPNVLVIPNQGKAKALNTAIKHFDLTHKYEYIFFMDADTCPDRNFLSYVLNKFNQKENKEIVAVVGRVQGYGKSWVEKYRMWEYQISHYIHKQAQANTSSMLVVPGCATVYKSCVFNKLSFPTGTLTEDMDFTFLLHRTGYSKMLFEPRAVVYTQDPNTVKDFIKQIDRWYTGFWQVVRRHNIPWMGQFLDLEVTLLALEGLYNGFLVVALLLLLPEVVLMKSLHIFKIPVMIDLFIFFIPTLLWSSVKSRKWNLIVYLPLFYYLRLLSSMVFLKCFFKGSLSKEKEYLWDTRRYLIK